MPTLEFHPMTEPYPLMSEEELEDLTDNMRRCGFDPRHPIVKHEGKIIDGRDRYRAVCRAKANRKHGDVKIEPVYIELGPDEDPQEFVERSFLRKHYSQSFMERLRQLRINRIAAKKTAGMSTRAIAEQERISQTQVVADLKDASEQGVFTPPEEAENHANNGKSAGSNKTIIRCKTCERKGQRHNCAECERLRAGGKPRGRPREPGCDDDTYHRSGQRAQRKAKKEAAQNGAERFTVKRWDDVLAPVVRMINEIAQAAGWVAGQRETPAHLGIKRKLEEVRTDVIAWQKELAKKSRN